MSKTISCAPQLAVLLEPQVAVKECAACWWIKGKASRSMHSSTNGIDRIHERLSLMISGAHVPRTLTTFCPIPEQTLLMTRVHTYAHGIHSGPRNSGLGF
eukprot:1156245-Pelagomonas_calceolata.AAC.3